jgi:hypothetical protein
MHPVSQPLQWWRNGSVSCSHVLGDSIRLLALEKNASSTARKPFFKLRNADRRKGDSEVKRRAVTSEISFLYAKQCFFDGRTRPFQISTVCVLCGTTSQ